MNILKRPMFFVAILCCVIATVSLSSKILAFLISFSSIALFVLLMLKKKSKYFVVLLFVVLFTISLVLEFGKISYIEDHDREELSGTFIVVDNATAYDDFNTLILKEHDCEHIPDGINLLFFDYKKTKLSIGDLVNVSFKIESISDNDKYRLSNYGDGIYATASIDTIKVSSSDSLSYKTIGNIRKYVDKTISSHFEGDSSGLLVAVTTGEKGLLSDDFLSNVKTTGISHVIVVSGMHLSIVMAAIYWFIDKIFYNKYIRCALSVIIVLVIFAICGFTTSITRAGAMFIVASFAPVFNRDNDTINSLLTAICAILIVNPFSVFNVSFLLSVLSTLAIIWIVPFYFNLIVGRFNIKSKIFQAFIGSVLCSLIATVFTLPVTIRTFGYASVVGPITNFIINIPITIALVLNILALLLSAIPIVEYLSYPIFYIAGLCSEFTVYVVNCIASLPVTVAVLPKIAFWWSLVMVFAIIGYMYYREYKKKRSDFGASNI